MTAEQPWDLYREIHKGLRFALFGVTALAGRTDAADDAAVAALVDEWRDVRFVLLGHHGHEDAHCDALVRAHAPALRGTVEAAHVASDASIAALDTAASALATAPARAAAVHAFHLALAAFTADYVAHLGFEEAEVMPALNRALTNAELEAVTNQIRGSVPPPDMCVFIKYMVPAMNFAERLDMLGGMHAFAPPEIFELFRAAAEQALPADDYRAVARAAGFA